MSVIIIAAVGNGRVIGCNGQLPWNPIALDMSFFRKKTLKNYVVMGSKTLLSIGDPLPDRTNIVLTRNPEKLIQFKGRVCFVKNIDPVLELAKRNDVYVIGGAGIYDQFTNRPEVRLMYITRVLVNFQGDTFFPEFSEATWKMTNQQLISISATNPYPLRFETWMRR